MVGLPKAIIKKYGVTKKAWKVFRGRHRKTKRHGNPCPSRVSRVSRSRSVRNLARRRWRGRSRGRSLARAIEPTTKALALIAPAGEAILRSGLTPRGKLVTIARRYTGYDLDSGQFDFGSLADGYMPYLATSLAWKGVHFVNKLVRKL